MNGLQSLMQGAPTQAPQPQQAQAPQGQAMPSQNDPRLNAAMGLVDEGVPGETKALAMKNEAADLLEKAMQLMQSAERQTAINQPPPTPPTVAEQVDKKTMEGVAGLLQRLGPGMQQRGQQAQQQQARQMVGGMPSMGAPNMQGMANGGIVGYAGPDGSTVEAMAPQTPMAPQTQNPSPGYLDPEVATFLRKLQELNKQLDAAFPQEKDLFEQKITDLLNTTSPRVKRIASDSQFGLPKQGMAMGGIVGYNGATGSSVGGMGAEGAFGDFTDRRNYMGETDEDIQNEFLKLSRALANTDVDAAVSKESDRFKELTGAEELMAERATKRDALEAQREARFSPEETRRRRISAGLAGLAERGLGGFGAGDTAERDKISAEQIAASEESLADMDKLIEDLRELGMGQFEAEKKARELADNNRRAGLSDGQAILKARQEVKKANMQDETTRRGQDMTADTQRYVADQGLKRTSAQDRGVQALIAEAEAAGKPITEAEALRQYFGMQSGIQGVLQRGAKAEKEAGNDARALAIERVGILGPDRLAYAQAQREGTGEAFFNRIVNEERAAAGLPPLGASASTTRSVDISNINPAAIERLRENPTEQNKGFFDRAFGVGAAAAVLGQ